MSESLYLDCVSVYKLFILFSQLTQ